MRYLICALLMSFSFAAMAQPTEGPGGLKEKAEHEAKEPTSGAIKMQKKKKKTTKSSQETKPDTGVQSDSTPSHVEDNKAEH